MTVEIYSLDDDEISIESDVYDDDDGDGDMDINGEPIPIRVGDIDHPKTQEAWDEIYELIPKGYEEKECESGVETVELGSYIWARFRRKQK